MLQKDFNGQVDWWLCRRGTNIGMVPANYLEIFHPHAPKTAALLTTNSKEKEDTNGGLSDKDYDVPKPRVKTLHSSPPPSSSLPPPRPRPPTDKPPLEMDPRYADYDFPRRTPPGGYHSNNDIYDLPPTDDNEPDYDLPPIEVTATTSSDLYARPPSTNTSPPTSNRVSSVSIGSSSNNNQQIYDIPPSSPSAIYDVPPNDMLLGTGGSRSSGESMDISSMYENEAEEFLKKNRSDIDKKFEELWQCVYGNNAYWGSEMKNRRRETLLRTIAATKDFDDTLLSLVAFGKGVHLALEHSNTKDVNFKKKYTAANTILVNKRKEILSKIDVLTEADEKEVPITAIVKALLEGARTIPQAVQAFVILVQANKSILFKSSLKSEELLPVLTKTEVKNRPLPELPETTPTNSGRKSRRADSGADYADIFNDTTSTETSTTPPPQQDGRRRNPHDTLPPLPFATLRKKEKQAPPTARVTSLDGDDYDDIDGDTNVTMVTAPPPPLPPRAEHYLSVNKRNGVHLSRQSSGGSSDGSSSPLRSRSPDTISTPYGTSNGVRTGSPIQQQPLKHEDRELLARYSQQMELLIPGLKDAIQTFLESIRNAETPKEFVVKSKLAVVAAYKLVYIADSLHQKLLHNDIKASIMASCSVLSDSIKGLVADTKTAALQYPSVGSVDRMKESLKVLFPACLDLITAVKNPPNI